jgi:hypothetical protein
MLFKQRYNQKSIPAKMSLKTVSTNVIKTLWVINYLIIVVIFIGAVIYVSNRTPKHQEPGFVPYEVPDNRQFSLGNDLNQSC